MRLPYAFVLGMSHSGSTLLAFLLNAHPDIISMGETSRVSALLPDRWQERKARCSCSRDYYSCEFWNRTLAGMAVRGHGIGNPDFFVYEPGQRGKAQARLKSFVEAALEFDGARVFLDSSKHAHLVHPLASNPHIDLRVIDLYRDGHGIVNSWRRNQPEANPERLIQRWMRQENLRRNALQRVPAGRVHRVHYEELVRVPEKILRGIFEFLAVAPDERVIRGYKSRAPHHIIGNKMRLDDAEEIYVDESWRDEFPDDWEQVFGRMGAGRLNQINGYEG